ncbi:GNAT family N-acetyltransferase, partial [uncultured Gimesia sp.]|uniref:GNAT family N-acetyltransferase n=1 Tax=uncultured Gimesia sp. TaxID=1678688 RepID=UPI00262A24B4
MQLFQNDQNSNLDQHPDHVIRLIPIFQELYSQFPGHLMQCRREGKLVAAGILLPKTVKTKALKALGPARLLQGYYLCGNRFLLEQDYQQDENLLKHLLTSALSFCEDQKAEFLLLEDLLINQPLNKAIPGCENRFLIYSNTGLQNRSLIHFPENPADYWKQFRPKSRIKQRKRLRQNSEMRLIRVTEPDQVADFLEAAHQISLNTWQTQRLGLRIKNDEKELEEMTFLALNGSLRSYLLMKDDQPVAFKVGYQHKGVYRDLEIGFDLNYASTSPGEALLLLTLDDLIKHDTPDTY